MKIRTKNEEIMQKNQKYTVKIVDYGANGEGVAKVDGYIVFVPFAIVGETVEILIIKQTKDYAVAKIVRVVEPDKDRVVAPCQYYQKCGGCQLQHIKYEKQLEYKTKLVRDTILKYVKTNANVCDCVASENQYNYRNKFAFPVEEKDGKICVGMYRPFSHDVVEIGECKIQQESKYIIDAFLDYAKKYDIKAKSDGNFDGVKHIVARNNGNSLLLVIVSTQKLRHIDYLYQKLTKKYKVVSIVNNINTKNNNVILGDKDIVCFGDGFLEYKEFGVDYVIGPHSFLQVNDDVKTKLYSAVLDNIEKSDVVIDGYSGAGLLSAIMAKKCKKVFAVEIVKEAVESAKALARQNYIENLESILGDCAIELPKILRKEKATTVVLDPPRKGCDEKVLKAIVESGVQKVVYVSCNPATLARDMNTLLQNYEIVRIVPFDMFPQTANVETLAIFRKK